MWGSYSLPLPSEHEKWGQFGCVFRVWVLLYSESFCQSERKKLGRNSFVFLLPSLSLPPHSYSKNMANSAVFFMSGILSILSTIPSIKKHGRIDCVFCVLPSSFLLQIPSHSHTPLFQKYGRFGCVYCIWVLLHLSPPLPLWAWKTRPCFSCFTFVFSPLLSLTPTQTWKMRPIRPRFLCLCSSLLPLKNHGQSGRFFRVLA